MVDESIAAVFQPLQYPSFLVCSAKTAHEHARAFPGPCAWSAPACSAARRSVVVTGPVPLSGRPDHRPAHPDRVLRAFQRGKPLSPLGALFAHASLTPPSTTTPRRSTTKCATRCASGSQTRWTPPGSSRSSPPARGSLAFGSSTAPVRPALLGGSMLGDLFLGSIPGP